VKYRSFSSEWPGRNEWFAILVTFYYWEVEEVY
jgi:hypothetical protein